MNIKGKSEQPQLSTNNNQNLRVQNPPPQSQPVVFNNFTSSNNDPFSSNPFNSNSNNGFNNNFN